MKTFFSFCLFIFISSTANAQECGTPESTREEIEKRRYYGNEGYLMQKLMQAGYDVPEDYFESLDEKGRYKGKTLSPKLSRIKGMRKRKEKSNKARDGYSFNQPLEYTELFSGDTYYVPLKIWVIHNTSGVLPGYLSSLSHAENIVDAAIDTIRNTGAPFEMYRLCDIGIIQSNKFYDMKWSEINDLYDVHNMSNAVNIYFANKYTNSSDEEVAGSVPKLGDNELFMAISSQFTLAHELGHVFGLEHTHRGAFCIGENASCNDCKQESVDRNRYNGAGCIPSSNKKKCTVNGDLLCDTAADPELEPNDISIPGCIVGNVGTDNWGDAWEPSATNIMAYGIRSCRAFFSFGQIGVMIDCTENSSDLSFISTSPGASISGPNDLCSGNTYTFTAPASWSNYTWEIPGNVTIIGSSNQQSITFHVKFASYLSTDCCITDVW